MGRYLGKVMVAGPNPAEGSIIQSFVFLMLDEENVTLTHNLPEGFEGGAFGGSAFGLQADCGSFLKCLLGPVS